MAELLHLKMYSFTLISLARNVEARIYFNIFSEKNIWFYLFLGLEIKCVYIRILQLISFL